MSGPETEESNGWNGIGLTRGAAVKKKNQKQHKFIYVFRAQKGPIWPYGSMGQVWDKQIFMLGT